MDSDSLTIFVVYKQPKDYPKGWVVRRWVIDQDGAQPDLISAQADTLAQARTFIPQGLFRFTRNKDDDECIFESWI